jgi:hypothetical protein
MENIELIEKFDRSLQTYLSCSLSSINYVRNLVWGMIDAKTVNLKSVVAKFRKGGQKGNYRMVQDFIKEKELDSAEVGRLVVNSLFAENEMVTLAIDRTEWKFGETWNNLLIISVLFEKTAVPIVIKPLSKRGNSHTTEKIEVIEELLKIVPNYKIQCIMGDREFIGNKWFDILEKKGISFAMRVRRDQIIADDEKCCKIKELDIDFGKEYEKYVHIGTKVLKLSVKRIEKEELAVVSSGVKNPLEFYKERWNIETGFKCLKTRGFNLEETRLKAPKKIKMLVQICSLAMTALLTECKEKAKELKKK